MKGQNLAPPERKRLCKSTDGKCGLSVPMILHVNIENLSAKKACVINQLATRYEAVIIFLQETYCTNSNQLVVPHFKLADVVSSKNHGLAMFVHKMQSWALTDRSPEGSEIDWLCLDVDGCKIVNVYKLPTLQLIPTIIRWFPYPCLYAGDFNCQHTDWDYDSTSPERECLVDWAVMGNLMLNTILNMPLAFSLVFRTLEIIQT